MLDNRDGARATAASYNSRAGSCLRFLRLARPPLSRFALELSVALGRERTLSRQALYDWEAGRTRVPAEALMAASEVVGIPLSEALSATQGAGRSPESWVGGPQVVDLGEVRFVGYLRGVEPPGEQPVSPGAGPGESRIRGRPQSDRRDPRPLRA